MRELIRLIVKHLNCVPMLIALVAMIAAIPAQAQVSAPFLGTWKVTWQYEAKAYEATMTVTESGGSWQTANRRQNNACAGRDVPMKVNSASPTEVQYTLAFTDVLPGCRNVPVVLKAGTDGAVSGTRSQLELTLTRQP